MSTKDNQSINNELLNIFTDMVTETAKLYNNLNNVINMKSVSDTEIKQELDALNKYMDYISSMLNKLENNLNSNEQIIFSKIKEEFKKLEKIQSVYGILAELNNITNSEKTQEYIEEILDVLFVMLGVEEDNENICDTETLFSASGIRVEQVEDGLIIYMPQGELIIQGDIKNIKVNIQEDK